MADGRPADDGYEVAKMSARDGPRRLNRSDLLRSATGMGFRYAAADPRFVIVTIGRTGSELLVSLLQSHPEIMCDSEVLHRPRPFPGQLILRRSAMARLRGQAYGFKLLTHHASAIRPKDPAGYLQSFHQRGFRLVALERRDWLQQSISSLRTMKAPLHNTRDDRARFAPVRTAPEAILAGLYLIEEAVTFLHSALAEVPTISLVYEEDLEDEEKQQRTIDRICAELGLPPAAITTNLVRITPRTAAEQLENFDEVADLISRTRYRRFVAAEDAAPATK